MGLLDVRLQVQHSSSGIAGSIGGFYHSFMAVWGSKIPTFQFLDVEMLQGLFWQMGWLTIFDEICTLKPALTIVLLHWCLCPWINRWYCSIRAPVTLSFTLSRVVFWVASGELAAKK